MGIKELATVEPINQSNNVLAVISRAATDKDVDISKMERLLEDANDGADDYGDYLYQLHKDEGMRA